MKLNGYDDDDGCMIKPDMVINVMLINQVIAIE